MTKNTSQAVSRDDSQWKRPDAIAQDSPAEKPAKKPKADPYDDPFAPQPKPKKRRKDPYDDPAAKPKKAKPRPRRVDTDPYDDPFYEEHAAEEAARQAEKARRAEARRKKAEERKKAPQEKPAENSAPEASDDPYDILVAEAEKPAPRKKPARKSGATPPPRRKKPEKGGWLTFVLCALIAICLMAGLRQYTQYRRFNQMRDAVDSGGFFPGTWVDGADISGMTLDDAIAHWQENVEPGHAARQVALDDGTILTARDAGYSSNYKKVLTDLWDGQQQGSVEDRYARLKTQQANPSGKGVERTFYTDEKLSEFAASAAGKIDTPVKQARLTGFSSDDQTFIFEEGSPGAELDKEKLIADIKTAFDNGGGAVTRSIATVQPTTTVADIKDDYGMRSSAVTNASSSSSNRLNNIKLALKAIDGYILRPGEEFSFNGVVGQRTTARGYKLAGAYSDGTVIEEVGGGICQVSTTLFNAAVKADLEITERRAHSLPVSYVDKGKDATVSWGSQDLKFKNNTDAPVCIVARLTGEKRVKIGVFGLVMEDGKYITVEAETTETIDFETKYQENIFLLPGKTNVLQEGQKGYKAVAYKLTWSVDGQLLSREVLCKSTYNKRDEIIEVGPMP